MFNMEHFQNFFRAKTIDWFSSIGVCDLNVDLVKNDIDRTYNIDIWKRIVIDDNKEFIKKNLDYAFDKLKDDFYKSIEYKRIKDENEKQVSDLQEKIKRLESKIESLQKYKDYYELNYLQVHGKEFEDFSKD